MQKKRDLLNKSRLLIFVYLLASTISGCGKKESKVTFVDPTPVIESGTDYLNTAITVSGTAIADGVSSIAVSIQIRNLDNSVVQGIIPTYSITPSAAVTASTCSVSNSLGISICLVKSNGSGVKTFTLTNAKVGLTQSLTFTPLTVAFTGNSNFSTPVASRLFNGTNWTLTGVCDYSLGVVTIGGNAIDDILLNEPTYTTTCGTDGIFSADINESCFGFPSPCYNDYGTEVIAFQSGRYVSTRLYHVASPTIVTTAAQLQAALVPVGGTYVILGNDIDLGTIANWASIDDSAGGGRISFFGDGHTLSNLNINGGAGSKIGFFGQTNINTIIDSVKFSNAVVATTGSQVGGVIGSANGSRVLNVSFSGTVNGTNYVGGLIGYQNNGFISSFKDCTSTGTVTASGIRAGGLVGYGFDIFVARGISTANVTATSVTGGLVGETLASIGDSIILDSTASGIVACTAGSCISGGLIGRGTGVPSGPTRLVTSYFRGSVLSSNTGADITGPIIGSLVSDLTISSSYYLQGLTCQWCSYAEGAALTDSQLTNSANFATWNFTLPLWTNQTEGITYPLPRR